MSHPEFARAARHLTPEALRDTLVALVDIASPTGRERPLAEYLVHRLGRAGFLTRLQPMAPERANAVAVRPGRGDGANLVFTGHMDTSYDGDEDYLTGEGYKPKGVVRDGWIWGLGANNMKSGLAAIVVALEAIAREGLELAGDLVFGAVAGETEKTAVDEFTGPAFDGFGAGTRHLVTHGVTGDCAILAEPSSLKVCPAIMGCIWARITVTGSLGHAALARGPETVNAIREMHALQDELHGWLDQYEKSHAYLGEHPNATIAGIRSGAPWRLSRNPRECHLYLDLRTVPGQTADDVKRALRGALAGFARARGVPEPRLEFYLTDPPTALADDEPVVATVREAHRRVTGQEAAIAIRRTSADSTHFNHYGVPCVVYGPGGRAHPDARGAQMHAVCEHVHIDDLVTAARVYVDAALAITSRPAPARRRP